MFISDIKRVVEQVSKDKGIPREVLIKALEEALKSAARKKFGNKMDIEVQYNEEIGEIEVFQFKEVAEEVTESALQISLEEGRKLDPDCEVGDSLGTKMDTTTFGRIAAQSAKQVIIQKIKDAEKDAVYANFVNRKGEIINGIVQRLDRGDIIVNLGHTEGIVPVREQVPKESYRRGDRIRALILDVLHESRGPQIILTRSHTDFLINLFKTEVPEISEGIVKILGAAREPGIRSKIAVASSNSDIDPVGACVGMKGSRVQNVVQELRGEKIDIISWHIDPAKYVCNALAPAEISRVIIDESNQIMEVIVPDEFLSIAIGKKGQNVRLASRLCEWHLDVKSESKYSEAMQTGYDSLLSLPGVSIGLADALYEKGFFSAEEIQHATVDDLTQIRDIDGDIAENLIMAAGEYVENADAALQETPAAEKEPPTEPDSAQEGTASAEAIEAESTEENLAETESVEAQTTQNNIADTELQESPAADKESPTESGSVQEDTASVEAIEAESAEEDLAETKSVEAQSAEDSIADTAAAEIGDTVEDLAKTEENVDDSEK